VMEVRGTPTNKAMHKTSHMLATILYRRKAETTSSSQGCLCRQGLLGRLRHREW
jgi:hypothetical protein